MPSHFYPSSALRYVIPNPAGFGISKGYWIVHPPNEQSTVTEYTELIFMVEFASTTLKDAEDHAMKVGRMFSSIASAYGGYPYGSPYLHRVASVGINGGMTAQHDYRYRDKPYMLSMFDQIVGHQFKKYLQSVSSIDGKTKYQLQSTIHWYGIAISTDDSTVSYVAAWTGLESIGGIMNRVAHPNGPKAACGVCGNKAGEKRNRTMAGISHVFNSLTKESLSEILSKEASNLKNIELKDGFSFDDARELRNDTVHGLQEIEALVRKCLESRRHLIHTLNASIQTVLGPSIKSWIMGDYEFHPDARVSLKFNEELRTSPYHSEWIEGLQYEHQPVIWNQEEYHQAVFKTEWILDDNTSGFIESKSGQIFRRKGDGPPFLDKPNGPDRNIWQDRPAEPVWERVIKSKGSRLCGHGSGCGKVQMDAKNYK